MRLRYSQVDGRVLTVSMYICDDKNILNPSNKIQCDDCKREISKSVKILAEEGDFCVSCFSNQD